MRSLLVAVAVFSFASPALARDAIPKDSSTKDLLDYLKNGGEDARKEACKRLGERKDPANISAIGELVLKDASLKVRVECVQALERIGQNPESAKFVREALLKDPEKKMREEAMDSIQDVDPEGGGVVAGQVLASDKELNVRRQACRTIERRSWKAAEAAVLKVVGDSSESLELRKSCVQAMVAIGSDHGYALAHKMMLEEQNDDLRKEASAQIEHHPKASSLEPLCKALKDKNDRIASNAVNGLKNLGMKEGAKCLREAAKEVKSDRLAGNMNKTAAELER